MGKQISVYLQQDAQDALENMRRILNTSTKLDWSVSKIVSYALLVAEVYIQETFEPEEDEQ